LTLGRVETIDFQTQTVYLEKITVGLQYDKLIIATGSKTRQLDEKQHQYKNVQGLYHLQDLTQMIEMTRNCKRAVIVGGGLIGIEMVEMLLTRKIEVTYLVREKSYWNNVLPPEESEIINQHIKEHHVDLRLGTSVKELLDENKDGLVDTILTSNDERLNCDFVGVAIGVQPNINFLHKNTSLTEGGQIEMNKGILINEFLETSQKNVYAIGDCAELRQPSEGRRPIEAVWYTARQMGEIAAYNMLHTPPKSYIPKLWFNSAKFFDIEYQVYGDILPKLPDSQATIFWQHADGKKSIRINFDRLTEGVVGFCLLGVRYRHEVCERWILEKTPIETVLKNLYLANFDPEFFTTYEKDLLQTYNQVYNKNLSSKKESLWGKIFKF
jgi:NADPH-dependent 2,4-dienoyl-CoA reductase/sulfur reductase-like enzyme